MKISFIVIICAVSFTLLHAQTDSSRTSYWIEGGMWLGEGMNTSIHADLSVSYRDLYFKCGYRADGNASMFTGDLIPNAKGYLFRSMNVSAGKRYRNEYSQSQLFIGPSIIIGQHRIDRERKGFATVGMLTEAQTFLLIAKEVGIGITVYGNLNFESHYSGVNLSLLIGNGL